MNPEPPRNLQHLAGEPSHSTLGVKISPESDAEMRFVKRLVTVCLGTTMILAAGYLVAVFLTDGAILLRPSALALERQELYTNMVHHPGDALDGTGVTVCIVDSGIDMSHEDLDGLALAGWKDFVNQRSEPYDDEGHGTAMAGILVANGWIEGMATGVDLLVAKALGSDGSGDDSLVAEAVDWCVAQGADIISLSLGGAPGILPFNTGTGRDSGEASADAIEEGVLVVAAAGNDGTDDDDRDVAHPSSERDVISVGGVTPTRESWSGSSKGENDGSILPLPVILPRSDPNKKPELVAPGQGVPVLTTDGAWGLADGTSASTVYVTGALALLLEQRPDLQADSDSSSQDTVATIKTWLMESVVPQEGQSGHDDRYGYGLLHMEALIERSEAD